MGETRRTYLQWLEEYHQRGWDRHDSRPLSVRRFLLENGCRITGRTPVFEIGDRVGERVIRDCAVDTSEGHRTIWVLAACINCGTERWYRGYTLANGKVSKLCTHCSPRDLEHLTSFKRRTKDPEVGAVFGELTVLDNDRHEYVDTNGKKRTEYRSLVQCSCGAEPHWVLQSNLRSGRTTRCDACAKKKARATQDKKYWHYADVVPDTATRRRLLARISACITRCSPTQNKCKAWKHYGGRGIRVEFPDRRTFLEYLITLPGYDDPSLELDRIDCDGNYAPGNLRFVTRATNVHNRRQVGDLQQKLDHIRKNKALLAWCIGAVQYQLHTKGVRPEELWPEQPFPDTSGGDGTDGA